MYAEISLPSHSFVKKVVYCTKVTKMLILECRISCLLLLIVLWRAKFKDSRHFPIIPCNVSVGAECNVDYNNDY